MIKTIDKIILGVLVVLLIGVSGVLITALGTNQEIKTSNQLLVRDTTSRSAGNSAFEDENEDETEDVPITGSALEQASAAALNYIGEGRVTDTEIGDEEGYYEIEITLNNGNEVDVHLDENFNVLSTEYEDEEDDD